MLPKYHEGIALSLKMAHLTGVDPFNCSFSQTLVFLVCFGILFAHAVLTVVYLIVEYENNRLELEKVLNSYEAGFAILHGIIKILALRSNRENFALLIKKSLKFWQLETHHGEELISSCEASNKFVMAMLYLLLAAALGNCFAFNATAFLLGNEVTFLFPIYKPSFIPSCVIYLAQNYIIFAVTAAAVGYDGILLSCIVMLEVQFKLLNNKLGALFVGRKHHAIEVDEDIRKCLDHHNYLLKFVDHSNKTYSLTLLVYLGNVILAMCVEFYTVSKQISPGITSKALLYIATILFQFFFFYCMPGQLLANESEITPNVVFSNNWEDISSPSVKCAIKLIIQRCQKPVSVLAGGIFPINLGSGLATLKTITSYYMFLRTVTEDVE